MDATLSASDHLKKLKGENENDLFSTKPGEMFSPLFAEALTSAQSSEPTNQQTQSSNNNTSKILDLQVRSGGRSKAYMLQARNLAAKIDHLQQDVDDHLLRNKEKITLAKENDYIAQLLTEKKERIRENAELREKMESEKIQRVEALFSKPPFVIEQYDSNLRAKVLSPASSLVTTYLTESPYKDPYSTLSPPKKQMEPCSFGLHSSSISSFYGDPFEAGPDRSHDNTYQEHAAYVTATRLEQLQLHVNNQFVFDRSRHELELNYEARKRAHEKQSQDQRKRDAELWERVHMEKKQQLEQALLPPPFIIEQSRRPNTKYPPKHPDRTMVQFRPVPNSP